MNNVRAHAIVSGSVQGVWYRGSAVEEAHKIGGLTGWVRNIPGGSVELVCEGQREKVEQLIKWLWHGPSTATVTNVKVEWGDATGEHADFGVSY